MGYYSQVALCLSKEAYVEFEKELAKLDPQLPTTQEIKEILETHPECTKEENGALFWYWSEIKWYDASFEIGFIVNFLNKLDDDEYCLMRVGEDYTDIEVRGCFSIGIFNVQLFRSIEVEYQQ
jgi:hypothetical protein